MKGWDIGFLCGMAAGAILGVLVCNFTRKQAEHEVWREAFHGCLGYARANKGTSLDEAAIRACIDAAKLQRDMTQKGANNAAE